jgi:hypothetical protein
MIAEGLQHLAQPITTLKPLPGNPRRGNVEAVAKSYQQFGQRKPLVALKDGTVIAGNHQLKAAQQLGWTEIAVVFVDDDEATAKAYALADNRTSDLGSYDTDALAELLADIAHDADLLGASGYTEKDLDLLLSGTVEQTEPKNSFTEIDPYEMQTDYRCPSCNYEWSGSPKPGAALHEPADD